MQSTSLIHAEKMHEDDQNKDFVKILVLPTGARSNLC